MTKIEMIIDSVRVSLSNYQHVIILKEKASNRYLPIWTGPAEADAISMKLQNYELARPMTHDFICLIINTLGGIFKEAIIDKLENDMFCAKIIVTANKKDKEIDCRPSDAIATAIRLNAPIFANAQIMKKAGVTLDPKTGKPLNQPPEMISMSRDKTEAEPSHFELFSDSAQNVLNLSEREAKRLSHDFICTGHLLLALTKQVNIVIEILKNLGISLRDLPAEIEELINTSQDLEREKTGLTTAVKETICLAAEESKKLGSDKIKPEHILTGLLCQDKGLAANLLKKFGITIEKIHIELIRLYSSTRIA